MGILKKYEKLLKTSKDGLYKNPSKVGQAVYDIMSKAQSTQTVEETIEAMTAKYYEKLIEAVEKGCLEKNYPSTFYVVVERKKETLAGQASNVLKHKYITSPFKPKSKTLREECPNSDFDLYEADKQKGSITLLYTLPTYQDSVTVLKNKQLYDPQYVDWIEAYNRGDLDQLVEEKRSTT